MLNCNVIGHLTISENLLYCKKSIMWLERSIIELHFHLLGLYYYLLYIEFYGQVDKYRRNYSVFEAVALHKWVDNAEKIINIKRRDMNVNGFKII